MPETGTPDCAASLVRIDSTRQHGSRIGAWWPVALLLMSVVLGGCTSQPPAPDAFTSPESGDAVPPGAAWIGLDPLPIDERGLQRAPSAIGMIEGDPAMSPLESRSDEDAVGDSDSWTRIRKGMSLLRSMKPQKRVMREIEWYRGHPGYLHRMTQRARPYMAYIVREVEQRDLPMEFALLPVVESAFRTHARSSAGALGLWQFIPSTGRRYGLKQNWWYDGRRDVVESTRAALDYLADLMREFDEDPLLAVAAYNWGEGNIRREISRNRTRGKSTDVWSLRLPRETRSHVSRLLAIAAIVEQPERYGVVLESIPDHIPFKAVPLDGQITLASAANLAGITIDELRRLNPGFKRTATAPGGPHRLQLPTDAAKRFTANLAKLSAGKDDGWARHDIVRGDTLGAIAMRYGTSITALKDINDLASNRIIAGEHLMVPIPTGMLDAPPSDDTARRPFDRTVAEDPANTMHYVRSGDSLWRIARRHGLDIRQLAAWNGLSTETVLQPGQKLRLIPAAYTPPPNERGRIRYRIKRGDSLWRISRQFGVSVSSLRKWNRLSRNEPLVPGRELFVHAMGPPAI